jgi:hypothetical protein
MDVTMESRDSSSAAMPSCINGDDFHAEIRKAVDNYATKITNIFNVSRDDLTVIDSQLPETLEGTKFWNERKDFQKCRIEAITRHQLRLILKTRVNTSDFSNAMHSLLHELNLISADIRMIPVDYRIANTDLKYKFDLRKFVAKIQSMADEWEATKGEAVDIGEKYIAPYFCFIQSSGMGKTKLLYEFAKLTKGTSSFTHEGNCNISEEFSCDLILSGNIWLEKEVPNNDVYDFKLELQDFVKDTRRDVYTVATDIQHHLEHLLVTDRSSLGPMKKTHVFLFDDAQVLLDTHYHVEAFLFRCIRTWLRLERRGCPTLIAVFSGTSPAILKYTNWKMDYALEELQKLRSSRDPPVKKISYSKGSRVFEPFITLTTMAVMKPTSEIPCQSEYEQSIRYGRPLFAKLHEHRELEQKLQTIFKRLLLDTGKDAFDWSKNLESWFSVLATRVQLGPTNKDMTSQLVDKGYANLTGLTHKFATFVYMPDPVCARLAMCIMDENWSLGCWQGKSKIWWSSAVKTLYSTGLCQPEKGNVGEVVTALYLLFCCDECRQSTPGNKNYTTFSVPLGEWINAMVGESTNSESAGKRKRDTPEISINFIQVCRDYMQSPWSRLADQAFLQHLYDAGTAIYTYPGCDLIDFVAPIVITKGNKKPTYSSVVVSFKPRLYLPPSDAKDMCDKLKSKADEWQLKSTLCIVCVLGQPSVSANDEYTNNSSLLTELVNGSNVAIVLRLPRDDRFGLTDIFLEVTDASEQSELCLSHSLLRASGQKLKAEDFFGRDAEKKNPRSTAEIDFEDMMKDLKEE